MSIPCFFLLTRHRHSYTTDPAGTFVRCDAKAIGAGSEGAFHALQEGYHKTMSLAEAEKLVLKVLKEVMEEKLDSTNVEVASVTVAEGFKLYNHDRVNAIIATMGKSSNEM